ncbi:MAG: ABC transporter substrate-binding protein, partial [Mycobacteriales bacterium]
MRKLLAAVVATSAVAVLVNGLVGAAPAAVRGSASPAAHARPAAVAASNATITMALPGDPGNLDPQQTLLNVARQLDDFAYDTLVHQLAGGKIVSGLATDWKVVSPTKLWFKLHPGVTCADGTKLTATVVKKNIDYVGNPANHSPLLGVFVPPSPKVVANNKKGLVTITLSSPDAFPLQGFAAVQMICARGLANRGLLLHGADGSGPYALVKAQPGNQYTLLRRNGYKWGVGGRSGAKLPAKVVLKIVSNETTAANLLLTGGLNVAVLT